MLGLNQVAMADDPVTVTVKDSTGDAIPKVPVYYRVNSTTDWTSMGKTNGSGKASVSLPMGTYDFHAVYHETTATQEDMASGSTVIFNTYKTVGQILDCANDGVSSPMNR